MAAKLKFPFSQLSAALLSILLLPTVYPYSAAAQFQREPRLQNRESGRSQPVIPAGTLVRTVHEEAETAVVAPGERLELTLLVEDAVTSPQGTVLVPAGSEIFGELEPAGERARFVARELRLREDTLDFDAMSEAVGERREVTDDADLDDILEKAAIGAAAAAILAEITGDIDLPEVLVGAGIGAIASVILDRETTEVIVIDPNRELDLTLQSDLVLPSN